MSNLTVPSDKPKTTKGKFSNYYSPIKEADEDRQIAEDSKEESSDKKFNSSTTKKNRFEMEDATNTYTASVSASMSKKSMGLSVSEKKQLRKHAK